MNRFCSKSLIVGILTLTLSCNALPYTFMHPSCTKIGTQEIVVFNDTESLGCQELLYRMSLYYGVPRQDLQLILTQQPEGASEPITLSIDSMTPETLERYPFSLKKPICLLPTISIAIQESDHNQTRFMSEPLPLFSTLTEFIEEYQAQFQNSENATEVHTLRWQTSQTNSLDLLVAYEQKNPLLNKTAWELQLWKSGNIIKFESQVQDEPAGTPDQSSESTTDDDRIPEMNMYGPGLPCPTPLRPEPDPESSYVAPPIVDGWAPAPNPSSPATITTLVQQNPAQVRAKLANAEEGALPHPNTCICSAFTHHAHISLFHPPMQAPQPRTMYPLLAQ